LQKEPKIYFFDSALVKGNDGVKFENFAAFCLLKHLLIKNDYEAQRYQLHYLRTKDGTEVDFAIVNDGKIERIIETKLTGNHLSKNLIYFQQKYQLPALQLIQSLKHPYQHQNIEVRKALDYLNSLSL